MLERNVGSMERGHIVSKLETTGSVTSEPKEEVVGDMFLGRFGPGGNWQKAYFCNQSLDCPKDLKQLRIGDTYIIPPDVRAVSIRNGANRDIVKFHSQLPCL